MMPDGNITNDRINQNESPIFIVGAPRSGTSLLRVLLNRHPRIGLCDETYFFYYVYNRQKAFGDLHEAENRRIVIDRYLQTARIRRLGLDLDALKKFLLERGTDYEKLFTGFLKFYAAARGKKRFGEKTPQHAFEAETISRIFPASRLIHIVRDPRDVVASLKRMPWGSSSVAANARLWRASVKAAERIRESENFLRVRYESLAGDTERELRRVCEFIGEEFDEKMLEAETKDDKNLDWWFRRARRRVSTNRIEKWREELSSREIAVTEWVAGKTMREMKYQSSGKRPSPVEKTSALAHEKLAHINEKLTNLPRLWYYWVKPRRLAAEEARIDRRAPESE